VDVLLTLRRRRSSSLVHVSANEWRVIVVRAWREGQQMRVRLLAEGDGKRSWAVSSTAEALAVVRALLEELDDANETPPATTR
jgi:hypothetical protein